MHDADRLLADLRDHLARHDKRVASCSELGLPAQYRIPSPDDDDKDKPLIPDVAVLTELCENIIKAEEAPYREAWDSIWSACKRQTRVPMSRMCCPAYV